MTLPSAAAEAYDASVLEHRAPSVAHLLRDRIARTPDATAYLYFAGEDVVDVTWAEAGATIEPYAAGLVALGVQVGDRVAIASTTRYEWVVANWAILCAGAATTTVYPTSLAADVAHIVGDSGSVVVVAEDAAQVHKILLRRPELPAVRHVVVIDPRGLDETDLGGEPTVDGEPFVLTADRLAALGRQALAADASLIDRRIEVLSPDDLATLIYTSGTTGRPKGVELTHDCLVYEGAAVEAIHLLSPDDLQYLWLPLAHVFGNILLVLPVQIGFPTCVDGRVDRIVDNLALVRPTFMGAAPRVFDKAYARICSTLGEATGVKARLIAWALAIGARVAALAEQGEQPGRVLVAQHALADRLVLSTIRARFGGRVRFFISGSARLDPGLSRFFASVGMPVLEGYGLTETSAATAVNRPRPGAHQHGSIGWPLPGTQARTDADGELLIKGPGVMRGYHGDEEATRAAFTDDGFLRTGDIAEIDGRGFICVTDRKKDLLKTAGGKYVAPAVIEARFKALCPYASQFVVQGEGRRYVAALVALDPQAMQAWAADNGLDGRPYADLVGSPAVRELVASCVERLNAGLNPWETIKRFEVLPRDLTVADGDLTPSLKLRRRVVEETFADQITRLYAEN